MKVDRKLTEELIYGTQDTPRFTQDSPVLPDVWIRFGLQPHAPQELLLTPHFEASAGQVAKTLRERLEAERARLAAGEDVREDADVVYTQSHVAACLHFDELVRLVLPMTGWWRDNVWEASRDLRPAEPPKGEKQGPRPRLAALREERTQRAFVEALEAYEKTGRPGEVAPRQPHALPLGLLWMARIVGSIAWVRQQPRENGEGDETVRPTPEQMVRAIADLVADLDPPAAEEKSLIWQVNLNRKAGTAIQRSTLAIKADAARLLFNVDCSELAWGVVDSGIDASHPAFWRSFPDPAKDPRNDEDFEGWREFTRVEATYDFTRIRDLLNPSKLGRPERLPQPVQRLLEKGGQELLDQLEELKDRLLLGRSLDWDLMEPFLRIPHDDDYQPPASEHGTHVAGILAADWPQEQLHGVCPDLRLYDLRVLEPGGPNDEFSVLAALQFIRHLNEQKDFYAMNGVNLSLSIRHDVANFACGRTPVCEECEQLVSEGVVVVAAAGNEGYTQYKTAKGDREGYSTVSITDPGNAEGVITVGATHRSQPHTYGVSYFSSRGPTGDGRSKPDLVAPGEKILGPTPGGSTRTKDGTSMAAPHVSGAAALLMARHKELIGQPAVVKRALCKTATDLGRERYFQGAGMLDVLRALQSV